MAQKIDPITKVSQITPEYIDKSIKAHYREGTTPSPLFNKTLAYDYKQKAKNLEWLFDDDVTITIDSDPEQVVKNLKNEGAYGINTIISFLDALGASYTAEQLADKKCIFNKQEIRISKVISQNTPKYEVIDEILKNSMYTITRNKHYIEETSKILEYGRNALGISLSRYSQYDTHTFFTDGKVVWCKGADGFYSPSEQASWDIVLASSIESIDIDRSLNQLQAGSVILSMDLNDFITCSSGGVKSCMGFGSSYHSGWINYFRSDFTVIAYLKNPADRFHKLGRQWIFIRFTKDGVLFDTPAMKLQKPYGNLSKQQVDMVSKFILKKAEDNLGLDRTNMDKITSGSLTATDCSSNMFGNAHAGYIDSGFTESSPAFALQEKVLHKEQRCAFPMAQPDSFPNSGISLVFDFPDALTLDGYPSHNGTFDSSYRGRKNSILGAKYPYKEVTCSVTGKELLDVECVFVADKDKYTGKYIELATLVTTFNPELLLEKEVEIEIDDIPKEAPKEALEDIEIDFDEDDF